MTEVPDKEGSEDKKHDSLGDIEDHFIVYGIQLLYFFHENDKTGC